MFTQVFINESSAEFFTVFTVENDQLFCSLDICGSHLCVFGIVLFKTGMFGVVVVFCIPTFHYGRCFIVYQAQWSHTSLGQNDCVFLSPVIPKCMFFAVILTFFG